MNSQATEKTCCKTAKALQLAGGICLIAGAFLALVFAFFIGVSTTVSVNLSNYIEIDTKSTSTSTIWDSFGPAYKSLARMFDDATDYATGYKASYYLPTILSTVVGAGTLISVLALTVIAALKYCRHFKDASAKYEKYAVAAGCTYIAGALAFFAINGVSMSAIFNSSAYENLTVTVAPSAISKAGMILVGILTGAYFVLKATGQGKALAEKGVASDLIFTVCSLVFTSVALCFLIKVSSSVLIIQEEISAGFNFQALAVVLATLRNQKWLQITAAVFTEGYASSYILAVAEQFIQIGLFAVIALMLVRKLSGFPKQKKTDIVEPVVFFFLALLYLVLACVCFSEANHYINGLSKNADMNFVMLASAPVAVLACATLNLIVGVGSRIPLFRRKKEQNAQPEAQPQMPESAEEPVSVTESVAEPNEE